MTSHCQEIRPVLGPLHDGELSADQSRQVLAHLEHCPECATELADIQRLGERVRSQVLPDPPEDLWNRIERELPSASPTVSASPDAAAVLKPLKPVKPRSLMAQVLTVAVLMLFAIGTSWQAYFAPPQAGRSQFGDAVDLAVYLDRGVPRTFVGTQPVALSLSDMEMDMCPAHFAVAHAAHLPGGFAAHQSLMGTCGGRQLVQTEYRRGDDRAVVLQYPAGAPVRVSRGPVESVQVAGRSVSVVPGARCWAATWQSDQTVIVVLGPTDRNALLEIVATVDGRFTKERS